MSEEITLTYYGTVYSKKNSKRIVRNRQTGRMVLVSSEVAQENERNMADQFRLQAKNQINFPCEISIKIYEPNFTRRDLDNQATSILDALKVSGVIVDDDFKHVSAVSIKFGGVNSQNPRAEITIREAVEIREFDWGRLLFKRQNITAETPTTTTVFHRYGAPRGNYKESWSKFRQELTRRPLKSIFDVYKYAERYDVEHFVKATNRNEERGSDGDSDEE